MNEIEQPKRSIKKFVVRHKTAILVTVTAVASLAFTQIAMKGHNDFLKEKGLYDEFYTPEESE